MNNKASNIVKFFLIFLLLTASAVAEKSVSLKRVENDGFIVSSFILLDSSCGKLISEERVANWEIKGFENLILLEVSSMDEESYSSPIVFNSWKASELLFQVGSHFDLRAGSRLSISFKGLPEVDFLMFLKLDLSDESGVNKFVRNFTIVKNGKAREGSFSEGYWMCLPIVERENSIIVEGGLFMVKKSGGVCDYKNMPKINEEQISLANSFLLDYSFEGGHLKATKGKGVSSR